MINIIRPSTWSTKIDLLYSVSALSLLTFMISNIANYGTQVMLGRLLGPSNYGVYNALMGMLMLFSVPISALSYLITRKVSFYQASKQDHFIGVLYTRGVFKLIIFGLMLIILAVLLLPVLRNFLHIDNFYAIACLGPVAMVSLFFPFNIAFSQGLHDFYWVSASSAIAGPLRFVTSVTAAWIGWGVTGTMCATFMACLLTSLFSSIPLRHYWRYVPKVNKIEHDSKVLKDALPVFISTLSFAILTQVDVILVKHILTAEQSGFYASAALLGKAVLYAPAAIVVGLIPMVAGETRDKESRSILHKALLLTTILSGSGACIFWFASDWVLYNFFGDSYLPAAPLLKYFGVSMLPMAFVFVIKAYFIAKSANDFSYVMLLGSTCMVLTILYCAQTPFDVMKWVGVYGCLITFIGGLDLVYRNKNKKI